MLSKMCIESKDKFRKKLKWKRLTFLTELKGYFFTWTGCKNINNVKTFLKVPISPTWVKLNIQDPILLIKTIKSVHSRKISGTDITISITTKEVWFVSLINCSVSEQNSILTVQAR